MEGSMEGAPIGGSTECVGARPLLLVAGASQRARRRWGPCENGKGAISAGAGARADWSTRQVHVFWLSSRKTVEHATADQRPRPARAQRSPQRAKRIRRRHSAGCPPTSPIKPPLRHTAPRNNCNHVAASHACRSGPFVLANPFHLRSRSSTHERDQHKDGQVWVPQGRIPARGGAPFGIGHRDPSTSPPSSVWWVNGR